MCFNIFDDLCDKVFRKIELFAVQDLIVFSKDIAVIQGNDFA